MRLLFAQIADDAWGQGLGRAATLATDQAAQVDPANAILLAITVDQHCHEIRRPLSLLRAATPNAQATA